MKQAAKILLKPHLFFLIWLVIDIYSLKSNRCYFCRAAPVHRNDWNDLILTIRERDKLHQLKEKVDDKLPEYHMHSDFYLIRWLRARNLNVDLAEKMLLENIKWREKNKMSTILMEDISDILDEYPLTTDCVDKLHRPVGAINFGSWDISRIIMQGRLSRLNRLVEHFMEDLVHQVLQAYSTGKKVTRAVILVDMDGFNIFQHACPNCISVLIRMLMEMNSYYPGFWEEVIIVNAPNMFRVVFEGLRSIIPNSYGETLTIFDRNRIEWMHYLDERIDRNQRYLNFGGTKEMMDS